MFFILATVLAFLLGVTIYISFVLILRNVFPFESGTDSDSEMDDDNGNEFEPVLSVYFTTDYKGRRKKNEI